MGKLIRPFIYVKDEVKKPSFSAKPKSDSAPKVTVKPKEDTGEIYGMNFDIVNDISIPLNPEPLIQEKPKKKSSRKKSSVNTNNIVVAKDDTPTNVLYSTEPYENKYQDTNNILRSAIAQIDISLVDMKQDIDYIRSSKTLKRKYDYLSMMQSAMGNFISNKISAARELNNTITKCNDMEFKRAKEQKLVNEKDDDKALMDMYTAFVNTPVGGQSINNMGYSNPLGPNTLDMTLNNTPGIVTASIGNDDIGYQNYLNNLTPSQNMMLLSDNPNIQQVVVYNQQTGAKYFEVMNMETGEVVPNAEKRDQMFMEDTTIDIKNKIARNLNLNESYPLIIVGDSVLNEY